LSGQSQGGNEKAEKGHTKSTRKIWWAKKVELRGKTFLGNEGQVGGNMPVGVVRGEKRQRGSPRKSGSLPVARDKK